MKNTIIGLVIGIILGVLSGAALYDKNPEPIIKYIPLRGSSTDSITIKADTAISAELFVVKYKLERIRHYNEIAAKGNNIKYLRGWLNRILNE